MKRLWLGLWFFMPGKILAHSGGVNADGCHKCLTSCNDYGYMYSEIHCHTEKLIAKTDQALYIDLRAFFIVTGIIVTFAVLYLIWKAYFKQ